MRVRGKLPDGRGDVITSPWQVYIRAHWMELND